MKQLILQQTKMKQLIHNTVKIGTFNSFKYKAKSLGIRFADWANITLINTTITIWLKYLGNFFRSVEMSLINCNAELKLKWTKYCVLAWNVTENSDSNPNNIIFIIRDTKLYVLATNKSNKLSATNKQKL